MTQEERRLAVDCSQRWIGLGLVLMDADRTRDVRAPSADIFALNHRYPMSLLSIGPGS